LFEFLNPDDHPERARQLLRYVRYVFPGLMALATLALILVALLSHLHSAHNLSPTPTFPGLILQPVLGMAFLPGLRARLRRQTSAMQGAQDSSSRNTPLAINAGAYLWAGAVMALAYGNFVGGKRLWRLGWKRLFDSRTHPGHTPAFYQAGLQRELKELDSHAELLLDADAAGVGEGDRFHVETAADGHTIYRISANFHGDDELVREELAHEFVHAVRLQTGESVQREQRWRAGRLARWLGPVGRWLAGWIADHIEEFLTISAAAHLQEQDSEILAHTLLPQGRQAEETAQALETPDPQAIDPAAQGLAASIPSLPLRDRILFLLRLRRQEIFTPAREALRTSA